MENNSAPSIEHLPVELFHRIFDYVDAQTILFSVRSVCRLFRSVVNSYNRYYFDFKIISKWNFHRLCRFIPPQHLFSLSLYKSEEIPNQISLFISNYRLRQLTQLHSLNLFGIDELQLDLILKRINLDRLTSFSLHIQKYDDRRRKTTEHYLSLIMGQPNLRKVEFDIKSDRICIIKWPSNCRIESLIINQFISTDDLIPILSCCPQLHRLILKNNSPRMTKRIIPQITFAQITSLTLEELDVPITNLESFLLLTPSLIYLKLIGENCIQDGKRWEDFIQVNLPHLDKFEFFINLLRMNAFTLEDQQSIIESFQSPFWIEYKQWFVGCQIQLNLSHKIRIYSIPICKSIFQYELDSQQSFLSTSNDLSITKNINEMILPLRISVNNDTLKRMNTSFLNVTKLSIDIPGRFSIDLKKYLRSIINISQLVQFKIESFYFGKDNKDVLFDMIKLLERKSKLSSLIIHSRYCKYELYPYLNDLCSILPSQINYLQIPINQLEQIEIILERCPYLSVIKFEITRSKFSSEVVEWFQENTIDSMFTRHNGCNCIWIGKRKSLINENPKRIKLMENESES